MITDDEILNRYSKEELLKAMHVLAYRYMTNGYVKYHISNEAELEEIEDAINCMED